MMQQQQQGVAQPTVGELIAQPERRQGRKAAAQAMQVIQESIRSFRGNRSRVLEKSEPLKLKRSQSEGGSNRANTTTTDTVFRSNLGGQSFNHAPLKSVNRGQQSLIVPILEDKENVRPVTTSQALETSDKSFLAQELMVADMPPPAEKAKRLLRSNKQELATSNVSKNSVQDAAGKTTPKTRMPFSGLEVLQLKKSVSAVLPDEHVTHSQEEAQKYPHVRSQRSDFRNEREKAKTDTNLCGNLQEEEKRESSPHLLTRSAPKAVVSKRQGPTSGLGTATLKDVAIVSDVVNTPIQMISKQEELIMKQTDGLNYQMSDSQQPQVIPEVQASQKVPETASVLQNLSGPQTFQAPAPVRNDEGGEDMTQYEVSGSSSNAALEGGDLDEDDEDDMMEDGEDQNMTQSTGRVNNNQTIIVGSQYQGRWTDEEHEKFLEGLRLFGKDWRRIEEFIGSRSCAQIRSHAQKYFNRLQRDLARGIKRADAAQAQMLLGKKKRKLLPQAPEEQPKTFQTTKISTLEPPIKQQKISQEKVPLLMPEETQDKKDIFSIVAPQGASSIQEFTPETPVPRIATQTNHQIEQIHHTLSKLSEHDIVLHLQELIQRRELISIELLTRKLQREVGGEILVQITHRFHYLAMQALQQGKFDICNRLIDERNLTQFVCILLSRQVFIGPPSRSSANQDHTSQWGEETLGSGNPEIIQKVDISIQPTTTRTPEESSTRPQVGARQQPNLRQPEFMARMQHLLGGVSQPSIIQQ